MPWSIARYCPLPPKASIGNPTRHCYLDRAVGDVAIESRSAFIIVLSRNKCVE
jgi:hypothetical protein